MEIVPTVHKHTHTQRTQILNAYYWPQNDMAKLNADKGGYTNVLFFIDKHLL